jgi:hypothetical protein
MSVQMMDNTDMKRPMRANLPELASDLWSQLSQGEDGVYHNTSARGSRYTVRPRVMMESESWIPRRIYPRVLVFNLPVVV